MTFQTCRIQFPIHASALPDYVFYFSVKDATSYGVLRGPPVLGKASRLQHMKLL